MIRFVILTAMLLLGQAALAQPTKMEPGPAHRRLDFLVGSWTVDARMHMPDEVHRSEHHSEIRWLPGGVWLEESSDLEGTPLGDMYGSARTAWDAKNEEYVRTWIDTQSHVTLPMRGKFIEDGVLEFKGSFEWTDGRVFHQRLVIRREADGWSQTGYMGLDPDSLRLNHEGSAVRRVEEPASTVPTPGWLAEHMAYMTRGGGRWVADNSRYKSETEPFDAYGVEWSWGIGQQSLVGRLFGLVDGEERGTFWEFRLAWHPDIGEARISQYGNGGLVGVGTMDLVEDGRTLMEQSFSGPDGARFRVAHEAVEESEDRHVTYSFDLGEDGSRTERRSYTWTRTGSD